MDINPYITLTEANDYFSTRLNGEDWDCENNDLKLKALKDATRLINNLRFKDSIVPTPDWLKEATCEIAINLLDGTDMEKEIENLNAVNQSYATVVTGSNSSIVSENMRAGIPSAIAWMLIKPHLHNPRSVKLCRGGW